MLRVVASWPYIVLLLSKITTQNALLLYNRLVLFYYKALAVKCVYPWSVGCRVRGVTQEVCIPLNIALEYRHVSITLF